MKKINVVTFKKTGHVLAAVTRESQPDAPPTVEQIAAGGIQLRNAKGIKTALTIPDSELGVLSVDYKTDLLHRPQLFAITDGQPEQQLVSAAPAVALTGTVITVTLPTAVNAAVTVWCQISGGALAPDQPIIRSITINGTATVSSSSASEPLILSNGAYIVAIFAPGYVVTSHTENVP